MPVINLKWTEIDQLVDKLASRLPRESCCWGVPRGGSVVAALLRSNHGMNITADWREATVAVDDIIDSGRTARQVWKKAGTDSRGVDRKRDHGLDRVPLGGDRAQRGRGTPVTRFLEQIGEDPNRRELERMPRRVVKFWKNSFRV